MFFVFDLPHCISAFLAGNTIHSIRVAEVGPRKKTSHILEHPPFAARAANARYDTST
jgi:hypothetical protein